MSARVTKFAYGVQVRDKYDAGDPEHRRRRSMAIMAAMGHLVLDGIFEVIVPQVGDQL